MNVLDESLVAQQCDKLNRKKGTLGLRYAEWGE
jgi:hypothetical protein